MNRWLMKLERKYGRYAIPNFMKYVIIVYVAGALLGFFMPQLYSSYLCLDIGKVLHGQIWRLVTFLLAPAGISGIFDVFFFGIELYLYYVIGHSLEMAWGAFRFNLYYISGVLVNILAAIILYLIFPGIPYPNGLTYINRSLFLAFAVVFPDMQMMLFFLIPIKMKWLGYIYAAMLAFEVISYMIPFTPTGFVMGISILVAVMNFLVFFFSTRNYKRTSMQQKKRKANFQRQTAKVVPITRHRCEVCGRTERDDPNLEFRFCSKCDGNHEYCMDHLYTHTHIHNS